MSNVKPMIIFKFSENAQMETYGHCAFALPRQNVSSSFAWCSIRFEFIDELHRTIVNQHRFDGYYSYIGCIFGLCRAVEDVRDQHAPFPSDSPVISRLLRALCQCQILARWQHAVIITEIDEIAFSFIAFNDKNHFFFLFFFVFFIDVE